MMIDTLTGNRVAKVSYPNRIASFQSDLETVFCGSGRQILKFSAGLLAYLLLIVGATITTGAVGAYFLLFPLVGATLYYAHSNPIKSIVCFLSILSMEGMYRYIVNFASFSYLISPVLSALIVAVLQSRGNMVFKRSNILPYSTIFLSILLIGFLQIFNPKGAGIYEGIATYSFWYFSPMLMYPIAYYVKIKKEDYAYLMVGIILVSILVSLVAILQYSQGSVWTYAHFPGSEKTNKMGLNFRDKDVFRPVSLSTMQGGYPFWSGMGVMPAVILIGMQKLSVSTRLLSVLMLIVNLYAILISGGRAALMVVIIQTAIYIFLRVKNLKSAVTAFILLLVTFGAFRGVFTLAEASTRGFVTSRFEDVLSNPAGTFERDRGANITYLPALIGQYPFGKGYQRGTAGAGATTDNKTNRESQFAALIADWGLIGMLSLCILSILFLLSMLKIRISKKNLKHSFVDLGIAVMVSYVIMYFIAPILQANYFFWMLMGFSLRANDLDI